MNDSTGWLFFGVLALGVGGLLHENLAGAALAAAGVILVLVGGVAKGVALGMREFEDHKKAVPPA